MMKSTKMLAIIMANEVYLGRHMLTIKGNLIFSNIKPIILYIYKEININKKPNPT